MTAFAETAWCVAVALASVLALGVPCQWLLAGRGPLDAGAWIRAPLIGLAVIALAGQNLVYLDVPLNRSAPWLWAAAAAGWTWMWRRGALRAGALPRGVFAAALAVTLLHGAGLLLAGARHYVGRAWSDQFNYTVIAEFLREEPYRLTLEEIGHRPYLLMAVHLKEHRLGQSVVHAFVAASAFRDAKTTFGPTILIFPALVVLVLYELRTLLAGRPARGWDLVAVAGAALLPGLALLHLEGFLSHGLALPLLLLWPAVLRDVAIRPGWRTLPSACLLSAAITSIYGELLPILAGLAAAALVLAGWRHPSRGLLAASFALVCLAPLFLNPGFGGLVYTFGYLGRNVLGHLYPWALQMEGLTRIWCGDLVEIASGAVRAALHLAAVTLTLAAYWGLLRTLLVRVRGKGRDAGSLALGVSLALLALVPLVVLARDRDHPYQFYKLALTVAPLIALGVSLVPGEAVRRGLSVLMLGLAAAGTASLGWQAGRGVPGPRSFAPHLLSEDARGLTDALDGLRGQDLVLLQRDPPGPRGVWNAWLTYLGRKNRVWLGNPYINQDAGGPDHPALQASTQLAAVPPDAVFLSSPDNPWTPVPPGARALWSSPGYVLWRTPPPGPWVAALAVSNPNGADEVRGKPFLWLGGGETRLFVLSGRPGQMRLSGEFWKGPLVRAVTPRVLVRTSGGHQQVFVQGTGPGTLIVPLTEGVQEIVLKPLDAAPPGSAADRRPLVLGILDPRIAFEDAPSRP